MFESKKPDSPFPTPSTGLPELDTMLHGVHLGDNIVWQIDSITDDYLPFVYPYWKYAKENKIKFVYFHFSNYPELMPQDSGITTINLKQEAGFERLVTEILDVIDENGPGAYYVFDCLSELAVDWYSERMLGNFFRLICPYLYKLDTVAYFALLKNKHITDAINAIHETAQVILEVYRDGKKIYVQPFKVDKRHSQTMYMLHQWENDEFKPVISSSGVTRIMSQVPQTWLDFTIQRLDVWPKTFQKAQTILDEIREGSRPEQDSAYYFYRLLRMEVTQDERFTKLAEKYFRLQDLLNIRKRMIGTGLIGGKAVGMLLARCILRETDRNLDSTIEDHDSFFIGSNVFYAFLIQNNCWDILRNQRNMDSFLEKLEQARKRILSGNFSEYITNQFREMLNYFGQSPIIVRSSSILEDAYGNSFSGKYDSVFCTNQGTPEERLQEFINAVRCVYASAISREALKYREQRGLLNQNEQMAILVQRVSGNIQGHRFYPHVAGVGISFNPYVWNRDIDPRAGMIHLVFGLGTRAVDHHGDDYKRIVALNIPEKRPETSWEEKAKYAQRRIDLLDLQLNRLNTEYFEDAIQNNSNIPLDLFVSKEPRKSGGRISAGILTFDKLLKETDFVPTIRNMLETLEKAYDYPVDIEFTVNFMEDRSYRINLLQCRPFQVKKHTIAVEPPEHIEPENAIVKTNGPIIGNSISSEIGRLIYVVPEVYGKMGQSERYAVARLIGRLTHLEPERSDLVMLAGPGRWGTTTPSLGVPVKFAEINTVSVLCEIVAMHEGLVPDVSLGTHFFNDLVEADMLYLVIFPNREGYTVHKDFIMQQPNKLLNVLPEYESLSHAVRYLDFSEINDFKLNINAHAIKQQAVCYLK